MPYTRKDTLTWQKGMYYHIYNRGVSKSTLFREPTNYLYVIGKIQKYQNLNEITVIAYCLNLYSTVIQKPTIKNTITAEPCSKDAFEPGRSKITLTYCTYADTFMAILSKTGWCPTLLTGIGQIISTV